MWYAIDLFTNEIHGPYDTDSAAWIAHQGQAVDVQWRKFKKSRKKS